MRTGRPKQPMPGELSSCAMRLRMVSARARAASGFSSRIRSSSECASRPEKPVDALHHLGMLDQVAPVGGGYSPVHAFDKLRLLPQHAGNGFLHHLFGGLPWLAAN